MKIRLNHWHVVNLNFSVVENENREKNSFDLNLGHFFPEDNKESFGIVFKIEIKDKRFDLDLECVFIFGMDSEITEDFKLSDFPKINAPAIAFPYVRALISNFTLQSGFEPVMLPSINFVSLAKEKETEG